MIETLISSKTRIKLLLKFFLNSKATAYLRNLESEFGESTNAIRLELNRLEGAGFITAESSGNKKIFRANTGHPLFGEIHNILRKHIGLDHIIEEVIKRLGKVDKVYLSGSFSKGVDSQIIDLIIIGEIDKTYLLTLVEKAEHMIKRKIRYLVYHPGDWRDEDLAQYDPEPLLMYSK